MLNNVILVLRYRFITVKLTVNYMSEKLIDINENIQLVVYAGRFGIFFKQKTEIEHGFLIFNLEGITYAAHAHKFSLNSFLRIMAIILAVVFLYFYIINSPYIFLLLFFIAIEVGLPLYDSLFGSMSNNGLRKIKSELEIDGYDSRKSHKGGFSFDWNNVTEVSFKTSECKLIIKTAANGNFEFHLYNDNFIGLHPECIHAIDSIKKILKHYLPDDKRKWTT